MTTLFTVIALGFFLGMRHATDPDHVIAVSTILDKEPSLKKASKIGIFWGIGHSFTILVFGGVVILFSIVIPEKLSMGLEMGVAFMLIILGLWNLRGFQKWMNINFGSKANKSNDGYVHSHPHSHGDYIHTHPHGHNPENHGHKAKDVPTSKLDKKFGHNKIYHNLRPVIIGVIHGFAGTAALTLMIIPLIKSAWMALIYLVIFGLGTIVGMMLITGAIALPFVYGKGKLAIFNTSNLRILAGTASLLFGMYMVYEIGFAQGLFLQS
ncbi:HoxN/HupN/NixA family nickel/cobalt transporter [Marixanthomonas spongiae]|uniref:Nickel/cobalt efflux system n=1 Tax=Marixanthomonas spongiae TaxID=2174845 RepID=A0A2U0I0K7_9FLAO|nr:high-affinity nickel-transport family protein [Marixanthomonas spongiae]PVW14642.1 high-affinity nickel-transport family protein [Marixanthomonas spongiae]